MLRDSVSAMEFSQPRFTITAVSKDLVRRPTRISYDLSLATLSHELGCLLADSARSAGSTRPVADALVCSYYVRCVSTPEIFGGRFGNHSRTGAVKLLITRRERASRLSSSGVRSPDYSLSPAPQLAAIQPPLQKDDSTLRLAYSALELSPWAMPAHAVGTLDARAEPTWPRPGLFVDRSYVPCAGHATAPAISGALSTRPNVDGVAGRIQRSELLPSRDALRAE